jgi:succinoglycan biosynthesis transport protein ExoP
MDLGQAFAAAVRHWILLLVLAMVGLSAGGAVQLLTSPTYRSTATVFFSLNRGGTVSELANGNSYVQDLVPSYVKVATMPIVLAPVITELGLSTTPEKLAKRVTVTLQPASAVAQIAAEDTDRDRAAAIANSVASRLSAAMAILSPRSSADTSVITVTTLSQAIRSGFPISPNRTKNLGAGLLGGLILGMLGVALQESIVTRPLTSRKQIEAVTDVPVIASIVTDPRAANRPLPVSTHPNTARAESFRILQTTLAGLKGDTAQCFVVVSAQSGEGRSGTAINLAIAMAESSRRVLLIDSDLRKPSIAKPLGIDTTHGLSSVLSATSTLEESIQPWLTQPWGQQSLDVLPAGPPAANPSELLGSRGMNWLLETVREEYDVVVMDSPPLLQSSDGALLAAQVDFAVMLVDAPRTRQRHLVEALARLRMAGAEVLGVVINRTAPASQVEYPTLQMAAARGAGTPHHASARSGQPGEPETGRPTDGSANVDDLLAPPGQPPALARPGGKQAGVDLLTGSGGPPRPTAQQTSRSVPPGLATKREPAGPAKTAAPASRTNQPATRPGQPARSSQPSTLPGQPAVRGPQPPARGTRPTSRDQKEAGGKPAGDGSPPTRQIPAIKPWPPKGQ